MCYYSTYPLSIDPHSTASHRVYGLGLPPSPSHSVSLTGHKPLLPPSSLLEACSSLSSLSALPLSLDTALTELVGLCV